MAIVDDAEQQGRLRPGMTIVEATGGNTGIGLAFVAAVRGYKLVLTMPETMSRERVAMLRQLGADVILTPGILMGDAVARAAQLVDEMPGAMTLDQFSNPANPSIHRSTTAQEILIDTGGSVDVFVSAVGTGGTITGVGEVLKDRLGDVRTVAVEPAASPVLAGGRPGPHKIQGIGAGFVPAVLNREVVDEVLGVGDEDAISTARELARREGVLGGISAGAALRAALDVAAREESRGKRIVVVIPDSGERYVSTPFFAP